MNSNKNKLIIVAVIILLLIGVFVFAGKKPTKSDEQSAKVSENTMVSDTGESEFKGNMFDLVKSGGNVTCTFSSNDKQYTMSGTSYISGKKMRVDSTTTLQDQKPIVGHMISDGDWVYSWSDALPQGFKMQVAEAEKSVETDQNNPSEMPALRDTTSQFNSNYDFKCKKWNVDGAMLQVPSDITFTDFSKMMPSQGTEQSACSACSYIQDGEAKAQCLQSLKCN